MTKTRMILLISLFSFCVLLSPSEQAWNLVWSDEFNGTSLNLDEWEYSIGGNGWGNNELEFYNNNNTRVENGHLVIHSKVEEHEGRHFTSAKLNSKKAWTYGKFECRAKLPKGKNLWPAIWMVPKDHKYGAWAASGEIDIMEARGTEVTLAMATIHYGGVGTNGTQSSSGMIDMHGGDLTADFHEYGFEWDKTEMRFSFDGKEYYKENIDRNLWNNKGPNPYTKNGQPFDEPFHWILNVAVGGNFFPAKDQVTPEEAKHWAKPTMEIDYVRVYEQK